MRTKYHSRFWDIDDSNKYDIYILQRDYQGDVIECTLSGNPLIIKWNKTDKMDPVKSSYATLELFSDTDRKFIDLYTVKVGDIRLDVYKNDVLYWSGTLDPELYQEPYSYENKYIVTVSFSDFSSLERLQFNRDGFLTLSDIITESLNMSNINYSTIQEYISTHIESDTSSILNSVSVLSDNFYDEDRKPMTWREVLDETLRPFALVLIQKDGGIYIYDLHSISSLTADTITWKGTDAQYQVDSVYNNVVVSYSPYEKTELMKGEVDYDSVKGGSESLVLIDRQYDGFNVVWSDTGEGVSIDASAKYYKIDPIYSGSKESGVAWTINTFAYVGYKININSATSTIGSPLMSINDRPFIHRIENHEDFKLRLNLEMLFDVRENPFERSIGAEEIQFEDNMKNWCNFTYVPFILNLRDVNGTIISHWDNKAVKDSQSYVRDGMGWVSGAGQWGDAYMCWYEGNRKNESGLGGWKGNKQIIGYYRGEYLPATFDKMSDGEYIDLPTQGGYLELTIGSGVQCYDYGDSDTPELVGSKLYQNVKWVLYKNPELTLVKSKGQEYNPEDIELSAWLNPDAKEEYKIETILGTMDVPSPTARGQLYHSSSQDVISRFERGGVTDRLEKLLAGTIYSNYASRNILLSGTVDVLHGFGIYREANEDGLFVMLSESQDLKNKTSEVEIVQFSEDKYEGIKYE